ncbi:MAG: dTDP-4-dehydrorhamnose reductase [Planctomycetes bacterium]|nr:dTDP-4-dehydrorhamnose reductase [Planctomycetota bacterium]
MTVLVIGSRGQLGTDLVELCRERGIASAGHDRDTVDIVDPESVARLFAGTEPRLVINAAAYTAVDRAEEESEIAFAVNRDGARHLAEACGARRIPLFHVSTDYVFDGASDRPYREDDPVSPLGVYGASKWEGEESVRNSGVDHLIVRVSWLFGHGGPNFVKTICRLAREREELRVVADQRGGPTPSRDLAIALLDIAARIVANDAESDAVEWGTYHFAGTPETSWCQFAEAIVDAYRRHETVAVKRIVPISTEEYPTPAARPAYSMLDSAKIGRVFGVPAPSWQRGLERVLVRWAEETDH